MSDNVETRQTRLEVLLEGLLQRLDERCAVRKETIHDHGERLSALETVVNQAKGGWVMLLLMLSGAAVLGGGVGAFVMHFLTGNAKG